ncbi:MAG: hypothetical protein M3Y44_06160 [Actinomycetota bacterium]|nr:hypothetical protein [Actinomycetota bacterium]
MREKPVAATAKDLQISESRLRRWMDIADVDEGTVLRVADSTHTPWGTLRY